MKSYKDLMNSLSNDPALRALTEEETQKLRDTFLVAYRDLSECCKKHKLTVMLIGGSVLGAVRHKGFIPWDDDMDVAMPRADFEKLKQIFQKELGNKYILNSPNYLGKACNRFPMMLVKNTILVETGRRKNNFTRIKLDIFVIENIPQNSLHRKIKGLWCSVLMGIGSYEGTYESKSEKLKRYLCKTTEGKIAYYSRMVIGKLFSFYTYSQWTDILDKAYQYSKQTGLMGIPSGRGHYFGEIRPAKTFLPVSKGEFEGMEVYLPGDPHDYLRNLYGENYMTPPPVEKRERHFILEIKFKEQ